MATLMLHMYLDQQENNVCAEKNTFVIVFSFFTNKKQKMLDMTVSLEVIQTIG